MTEVGTMARRAAIIIGVIAVAASGTALATTRPWRLYGGRTSQGGPVGIGVDVTSQGQLKSVSVQIGFIAACADGSMQSVTATFLRLRVHLHHQGQTATFNQTITTGRTAQITGQMTRARAHGTFSFGGALNGQSCHAGPFSWSARTP